MIRDKLWPAAIAGLLVLLVGADVFAQSADVESSAVAPFLGTWTIEMTNPAGSEQTVRIVDQHGVATASLQIGSMPPLAITGIFQDREMLILTTTLRENGAPIWAVIALTLDGQTMNMAQMLQRSQTIKRGSGQKVK
jgi:hypothetical protein